MSQNYSPVSEQRRGSASHTNGYRLVVMLSIELTRYLHDNRFLLRSEHPLQENYNVFSKAAKIYDLMYDLLEPCVDSPEARLVFG